MKTLHTSPLNITVVVAGLGFFVDAFDLFLFNVYRIPSLKELGFSGEELTRQGEKLLSLQMAGMMLGGIISGVLADKKGRVAALFGSIILYSSCNIANGFVQDINMYGLIRFLAGLGLAGELGAGITLVSESMTVEKRGYGTILVATLGALGAVAAGLAGDFMPWRQAFIAAGAAGFLLLFLRIRSMESYMFAESKTLNTRRGSFRLLFSSPGRFSKYLACILMGIPIWYSVGLLITLSPEIAKEHGIEGLKLSTCFILFQAGVACGDLSSGVFSQWFKTRKKVIITFMGLGIGASVVHFFLIHQGRNISSTSFFIGLGCGYLSVFVTATAEQFGTNLRATVTATVTNFMRGAVTLLIPFHRWLEGMFGLSLTGSLMVTGGLVWAAAVLSAARLPETFGKDLSYSET